MPIASVGPEGTQLSYIDSGPPSHKSLYTTLVIIHGYCWNGGIFQKLADIAPSHGFRVISLNRRDYHGSSPFTPAEMQSIRVDTLTPDDTRSFMKDRASEYAAFVKHLVDNEHIPLRKNGEGGVVLMAWSLGCIHGMSFLDNVKALPSTLSDTVTSQVRAFILFDPPFEAVPMPPPTPKHFTYAHTIMSRFIDPSDPGNTANLMKGVAAINDWLSGWFRYSPLTPGTDAAKLSEADKAQRYIAPEANPIRASTRSAEADDPAFSACNEFAAAANEALILHELSTQQIGEGVLHTAARNVLFTDPSVTLWPGMRVECVYCANSCWTCVYAGETIKTSFESAVPGRKVRLLDDANHFIHWTDPQRFVQAILPLL